MGLSDMPIFHEKFLYYNNDNGKMGVYSAITYYSKRMEKFVCFVK